MRENECRNEAVLAEIRTLREKEEVVVLSLSTLANLTLRKIGIDFVTPDCYLPEEKSAVLDETAFRFCREWYTAIDSCLMSFHGVSIGETLEYDFYMLFVDALRSVEISESLLEQPFDGIFLPQVSSESYRPDECYFTLPLVLRIMACGRRIRFVDYGEQFRAPVGIPGMSVRLRQVSDRLARCLAFPKSCILFLCDNFGSLKGVVRKGDVKRYALTCYHNELLARLNADCEMGLKVRPSYLRTRTSKRHTKNMLDFVGNENTARKLCDSISYEGVQLWRALHSMINQILRERVPLVIGTIQWTELFARFVRPTCFVVDQEILAPTRSICLTLKSLGIPVVVIQHGILTIDCGGLFVMPKAGVVHAVWGEYYRNWHFERGREPGSQAITGCPRYDELVNLTQIDRGRVCNQLGLDPALGVVLVATEHYECNASRYTTGDEEDYIRKVLRCLKGYDRMQIVVKLHPAYQDKYEKIVSGIAAEEKVNIIVARDSLWDLIRLSSFVIVATSTVCLEALILGKPVISVNLNDNIDHTGLVMDSLAIGAFSEDEIAQSIRACIDIAEARIDGEGRKSALCPFVHNGDGLSGSRVASLIRSTSLRDL